MVEVYPHTKLDGNRKKKTFCGRTDTPEFQSTRSSVGDDLKMKRGKAAGLEGVTTEHLQYCRAILPCVLAKLFNLMIRVGHAPTGFGQSYTIPVRKSSGIRYSKCLMLTIFAASQSVL